MSDIYNETVNVCKEFIEKANLKGGELVVIGCSTSEVIGEKIGSSGTVEVAEQIVNAIFDVFNEKNINIAAQCCEHLNRALVVSSDICEKKNYEKVCVVPQPHAGGSFATTVYKKMDNPVMVEEIKADAGIDIGLTMIGMHIKHVAVPLRLTNNHIGSALITSAYSRPKLIGGIRARYE